MQILESYFSYSESESLRMDCKKRIFREDTHVVNLKNELVTPCINRALGSFSLCKPYFFVSRKASKQTMKFPPISVYLKKK